MIQYTINETVELKMLSIETASTLFLLVDCNRGYLRQWLPWLDHNTSVNNSETFIKSTHLQFQNELGFMCGVYYKNELVGMCGYHPIDKMNRSVTIGYWLSKASQGQGIVTDCVRFLVEHAFNELKLNKVLIPVAEKNHKSQAIPKRLGFTNEGLIREAEFLYTEYVNHISYTVNNSFSMARLSIKTNNRLNTNSQ